MIYVYMYIAYIYHLTAYILSINSRSIAFDFQLGFFYESYRFNNYIHFEIV